MTDTQEQTTQTQPEVTPKIDRSKDTFLAQDDPFAASANLFGIYSDPFFNLVDGLSTGQLRRLVKALVTYPLNNKEFITDESQKLKQAFHIGDKLIKSRTIMEMQVMMEHEQKLAQSKTASEGKEEQTLTPSETTTSETT